MTEDRRNLGLPFASGAVQDSAPDAGPAAAFFFGCLLAAGFGKWMAVIPGIPITVWPPNGVLLAALLLTPRRSWPWWLGIAVAAELTSNVLWFHNPILPALGYAGANAVAVAGAALALSPFLNPPLRGFATLKQVAAFLLLAVLAPLISATLIGSIDMAIGKAPFHVTWPLLWVGDATGILIATPLVICIVGLWRSRTPPAPATLAEAAAIAVLLAGLAIWQLNDGLFYFVLFLPVLWAALRFDFAGASLAVLMLAVITGFYAQDIEAPSLAETSVARRHARLQGLVMVAASMGLVVAALTRQQRRAVADLAVVNATLEARVAERTREIEDAERRFRATFKNAAVGIAMVGADGRLMRVNERLARLLGYSVEEMEGASLDRITHPEDLARGNAALERLRRGEADEYELEKRYLRSDGKVIWGHTSVSCARDAGGNIAYLIKVIQDITDRKRSEEIRQLLMGEVNHRSKNMLATVQAIARQTAAKTPDSFIKTFGQRLQALAANQDLLVKSGWEHVDLMELARGQLGHFGEILDRRIVLHGPAVQVSPAVAQTLGMALHELGTNAVKYGSLSNETGRVEISWALEGDTFRLTWRETGGPAVEAPEGHGFGRTVLDRMIRASLSAEVSLDFAPDGLVWTVRCPRSVLRPEHPPADA